MNKTKEYFVSTAKHIKINFNFNFETIAQEAKRLKKLYHIHREGCYDHKGWKSLVLHGLGESHTDHWKSYGYDSSFDAYKDMKWTSIADQCPNTMDFLLNYFPCEHFGRVRFMLVEAGGHIGEHCDSRVPLLDNTNISLINPENCIWQWGDGDSLFMHPGQAYIMNIHYPHSVYNKSDEDRYHLIVHRLDCTPKWKELFDEACQEQNVTGKYHEYEVLV
jgi:hypothetical protein